IMCDHVSTLLFSPTKVGYANLLREGFKENNSAPFSADNPKIYHCGDVMYDNSLYFSAVADQKSDIIARLGVQSGKFILATIHRNNNTDEPARLSALFRSMHKISKENDLDIVLPLHPRTAKLLETNLDKALYAEIKSNAHFKICEPASFLEMVCLEKHCKLVMTDSGGVQKEAFFYGVPCITMRDETEWVETVELGWNRLVGASADAIVAAVSEETLGTRSVAEVFPYGRGDAARKIINDISS
ncbi:MAG TPA: UDP-N-acetylglucosamine 2-epimerase, partial [Nitrospira sp.]|nr:UDP-N-acetylglucosamine 2-epimerase [Nitrospira sp.]